MPRISHGSTLPLEQVQGAIAAMDAISSSLPSPIVLAEPRRLTEFGYLFPDLQSDDNNLLASSADTVANLIRLGNSMRDTNAGAPAGNNPLIPAAYTYLGQFIDHDITLEALSSAIGSLDDATFPTAEQVLQRIKNQRTATLDLDSVYDPPAEFDGDKMKIGHVSIEGHPVPGKGPDNDLRRSGRDPNNIIFDRFALIGDARNDENLVVAQLHLAFLRAHNELVTRGQTWQGARRMMRQLYQWLVIQDFARKVAGSAIVDDILANGNRLFDPVEDNFSMPLEYSVAAYRFGHSMIRGAYNFNVNFGPGGIQAPTATLKFLFTFTALSDNLGGFDTLPENWVIQWERFLDPTLNATRKIDSRLVEPLFHLQKEDGSEQPGLGALLAVRNLLRGYKLRMPTGQAVAAKMGVPVLSAGDLMSLIQSNAALAGLSEADKQALQTSGFDTRTPLWFYILAESELTENGERLGAVGGTIVAEVLIGLARRSADSIFQFGSEWNPSQLGEEFNSDFTLADLFQLAGVLEPVTA